MKNTLSLIVFLFVSVMAHAQVMQQGIANTPAPAVSGNTFTPLVTCPLAAGVVTTGNSQTTASCNTTGAKLIVVAVATILGSNTYTLTSSPSNTWTCSAATVVSGNGSAQICYSISPTTSGTMTFSVLSVGGTTRLSVGARAYSDTGTPAIDGSVVGGQNAGVTVQPGSITPSVNNDVFFTVYSGNGVGGTAATIDSSFTVNSTNTASFDSAMGDQIQTSGVARNPTWTGSDSNVCAQMVAFKP